MRGNQVFPTIVFFHNIHTPRIGVMSLSAVLRKHGYPTDVVIGSKTRLLKKIRNLAGTAIVCHSAMTTEFGLVLEAANAVKTSFHGKVPQFIGGNHATLFPELIPLDVFDACCVGEGERVIVPLVERTVSGEQHRLDNIIDRRHPLDSLEIGPLLGSDEIPFSDMELYADKHVFYESEFYIASGRRCPFQCTYCHNHVEMELFRGKGDFFTQFPVDHVIQEARATKDRFEVQRFAFRSDLFASDRRWIRAFAAEYRKEIHVPFFALLRPDLVDPELAQVLAEARCNCVEMGIETGNEERRNKLLNKKISNQQIRQAVETLRQHGIEVITTNMLGLPGETYIEALETICFNRDVNPNRSWYILFVPFPKTELGDLAVRSGLVGPALYDKMIRMNPHRRSLLSQPDMRRIEILHKFSQLIFRYRWMDRVVELLSKGPYLSIYYLLYRISYFLFYYRGSRRLTVREQASAIFFSLKDRL